MNMKDRNFTNPSLKEIKQHYDTRYVKEFERVISVWNNRIRSFIKQSMGVSLTYEDQERHAISIKVKPAYNKDFFDVIEDSFPDLDFDEFYMLTNLLKEIDNSKPYFIKSEAEESLKKVIDFTKKKLNKYDLKYIIGKLFNYLVAKDDITANYFPGSAQVCIYVVPIVLLSKLMGLNQESLIVIALTHELAHAHSHLGRDKDGNFWRNYEEIDKYLAEGIAQYYTERFVRKVEDYNFNLPITFRALLDIQSSPYKVHTVWKANFEQVASALIQVRSRNQTEYQDFEMGLRDAKGRIISK